MEIFEPYIIELREFIETKRREGKRVVRMRCPAEVEKIAEGLPLRREDRGNIILKEDTWVELGSPKTSSSALVLWTENLGMVDDGSITLIGQDVQNASDFFISFSQIVIIGGVGINPQHYGKLKECQYVDNLEGYMVRAVPQRQRVWSRISKEAVEKGFTLETLGRALMYNFKSRFHQVKKVEVVFVTSSDEDVRELGVIAGTVWGLLKEGGEIQSQPPAFDCSVCENREICEAIWEILSLRKGMPERPGILCRR